MKLSRLVLVSFVVLSSCRLFEKKQDHSPLESQRLVVRQEFVGRLTNHVCKVYDGLTNECKEWSMRTYSLEDAEFRRQMNDFVITCEIGGRRFKVCLDKPGYCRHERVCLDRGRRWYWPFNVVCKDSKINETYIDAKLEHEYLLNAGTECMRGY